MAAPLVSVVIPTTGRSDLSQAVASVQSQTLAEPVEIIVVSDGGGPVADLDLPAATVPTTVLATGGREGAPAARNLGVQAARGRWVAFLDDDDEWFPTKLADQLTLADEMASSRSPLVVSGRVVARKDRSGSVSRPIPDHVIGPDQSVADYLFRARRPSVGRASLFTSTLLAERWLCRRIPWATGLRRHQDWDWLIRSQTHGSAQVVHAEQVVASITVGSEGSISASPNWQASLDWAESTWSDWSARTKADFLAAQPLRYALTARSLLGVRRAVRAVAATRRVPSPGPLTIGLAGIAPRRALEQVLTARPTAGRGRLR